MPPPQSTDDARRLALELFAAAVEGADPAAATARALTRSPLSPGRVWLLALGKAASTMSAGAVRALAAAGHEPAGGLVVAAAPGPAPHAAVEAMIGDHPVPGERSRAAADRLAAVARRVGAGDVALVLLSGGTTSLVGAPVPGVSAAELAGLFDRLLASGADIAAMNALRKRFLRWGGGRLATALAPAAVRCLALSDVAGDDPAVIGSGPCVPDPTTAAELLAAAGRAPLAGALSPALHACLEAVARGERPETPKPGDAAFDGARTEVVLANRDALEAAAAAAARRGLPATLADWELSGPAAAAGERCAERLRHAAAGVVLWGGETTVALGGAPTGRGGRAQELALAAARRLHEARAAGVVLLAAGTDGRDGPTDAAGAIVDHATWARCLAAGVDPAAALERHDAYTALDAAGALLRTGPTGTNVRDVVIGIAGV